MTDLSIKQFHYELSGQDGLTLIGKDFNRINLNTLVYPAFTVQSKFGVSSTAISLRVA